MKTTLSIALTSIMIIGEMLPAIGVATVAVAVLAPVSVEAAPIDRAMGRQGARDSRQTGRQVSQARRRGYYGLPGGAVPYAYRGINYYRVGGRYMYPYFYGGRTVYIDIDVVGGYPVPPPAAGSINIDIY